ncbi:DUF2357 domain-containing protein [Oceanobacillus luteolus]|uniref:DUF2357 domain-containing protein n=1 Tax=Oceanobacillus luteolus TaxID=1274358 RepID=A0ABW4HU11_9BACI
MATLPSGSREDIELVHVETDDLSLIIKGRPYHERYESLKQYRSMDFHDTMGFVVNGRDIEEIKVYDIDQNTLVEPSTLRPIFFENSVYQVIIAPKQNQELSFHHEHPGIRNAISSTTIGDQNILMGNLQFQNEVGLTTFRVFHHTTKLLEVTLEIFPSKLDYRNDYKKLLEEVNDEIYNLAFHFIRKTYHGAKVKLDGKPSRAEFYRLIEHYFERFIRAISNIEKQPNHNLQKTHVKARGDQIGKLDSKGRSFLRKRPELFVEVERGIPLGNKHFLPTSGLRIKKEVTYDTNENRYIKWMMERLVHKLEDLHTSIQEQNRRFRQDDDQYIIGKVKRMITLIDSRLKQPFWKRIGKLDRSTMSLVLQMAPNYRDANQIYLTISRGLVLDGKVFQMSVKDVATLYEYWTFLKLGQILGKNYQLVSQDIVKVNRNGLFVVLDANQSAKRIYRHPVTEEKIILTYQKYENKLPTVNQKPDTMLSLEKKGKDYHYNFIFDAKYRVDYAQTESYYKRRYGTPGPLEEDINTMHRYRDSIVAGINGPYERTSFGAYVLFPWFDEQSYQHHHFYKSIDRVNIGGLPFLPDATNLVEQFVHRLVDKSPEELQKEGILPRGTVEEWQSSLQEIVLVGLVDSHAAYRKYLKGRYYSRPINKLKNGWQKANYIALYVKKSITEKHGVFVYGKIKDVQIQKKNVIFEVEIWENLLDVIKPVQYGIANYMLTTLDMLKDSTELPELFMKSKEEVTLWKMLRRVSDRIQLELDDNTIDYATGVTEFRIKDINIQLKKDTQELAIDNGNEMEIVPYDKLKRNPSAVFRMLVGMLES